MTTRHEVPLCGVWTYDDRDREFWAEHLEEFVPGRIFDAHTHFTDPATRLHTPTEELRRQMWVNEVNDPIDATTAERCMRTVFPGRQFGCLGFGWPSLDYNIESANDYVIAECARRSWYSLAVLRPQWSPAQVSALLDRPGCLGVKPYYAMIGYSPDTRDQYLEASIFDFLPHAILELLNERRAWVTLHVPKAGRLGHPENIREVRELHSRYPNVTVVIAHLGRSYTLPHAEEGLAPLAEDEGLYFDISAVLNPAVLRYALERLGPRRVLWGTDNPVFYMRGRRTWQGRTYINHTSHDFHFNKGRHEPPEVEARYTLFIYEALRGLKQACAELGLSRKDVEAIFHDNAQRLIDGVLGARKKQTPKGKP